MIPARGIAHWPFRKFKQKAEMGPQRAAISARKYQEDGIPRHPVFPSEILCVVVPGLPDL